VKQESTPLVFTFSFCLFTFDLFEPARI
jgi:hypothetical protein